MGGLILPKTYSLSLDAPLIYLAGPIQGAPRWQEQAHDLIKSLDNRLYVASPSNLARGELLKASIIGKHSFADQLDWENFHMRRAARAGCLLFWLAEQVEQTPGRSYARDTRRELGKWVIKQQYDREFSLVFGGETGFDGLDTIIKDTRQELPFTKFYNALGETCMAAIAECQRAIKRGAWPKLKS